MPPAFRNHTRALHPKLVIVVVALGLFLVGQEDCLADPPPSTSSKPLALDCVIAGSTIYIPLEPLAAPDRPFLTAGTGSYVDVSLTARLPYEFFCALNDAGISQVDLGSATVTVSMAGVSSPIPPEVVLPSTGLPIPAIDTALACGGSLGAEVPLDFPPVTSIPWADGAWTVDFLLTVGGFDIGLTNLLPAAPDVSLVDLCVPTDKSVPPNGATDDPEDSPRIAADLNSDGLYDVLAQPSHQIQLNVNGWCAGYKCDDFNDCTIDTCLARAQWCTWADEPDGTSCDFGGLPGLCMAGACEEDLCAGVNCDDGDPCTTDSCDPLDGTCIHVDTCDDLDPPELVDFDFNPKSVDVTNGAANVTCDATLTDNISGVYRFYCRFLSPSGALQSCVVYNPSSGDETNGTWSCDVAIPQSSEEGTWQTYEMYVEDNVGNGHYYYPSEIAMLGFPTQLDVTSQNSDSEPPVLASFDFNPKSVDVTNGAANVTCDATLTDNISGVYRFYCRFLSPSGALQSCVVYNPSSGDETNGTWSCDVAIPQSSEEGTWQTYEMYVEDNVGNGHYYYPSEIAMLGFPTQLDVTSQNSDSEPPVLASFDFNPKSVDVTNGAANVTCDATLTDNISGVYRFYCRFLSPSGALQSCVVYNPSSGDETNGTWSCDVAIPQSSEEGTWQTYEMYVEDNVGNGHYYYPSEIAMLGFPTQLDVTYGPPSWGAPVLIETSDLYAGFYPAVAVDANGDVTAVWSQTSGVFSNRYTSGAGWGTAVTIGGDNTFDSNDTLDVAVDANGNATAVWGQSDGLWSNRYTSIGGWGTAALISSGTSWRYHPRVVVDSAGNVTAAWFQAEGSTSHVWTNRYTPGGGWGTPVIVDTSTGNVHEPEAAVDPSGNVTVAWSQWDGVMFNVWAIRHTPGGGWGTAVLIDTEDLGGATGTHVATDLNGNVMATWTQHDGSRYNVWANRYTPSGGWGTAVLIAAGTSPYLAVDPDGNAMALWTSGGLWASRYTPSGGWGTAEPLDTSSAEARADVIFDPHGNATVVWTRQEGTKNVWSNRYTPGGGWGTAVLVETNDTGDAFGPRVAVDPNGRVTVVWSQRDPGDFNWFNIWSNRYE